MTRGTRRSELMRVYINDLDEAEEEDDYDSEEDNLVISEADADVTPA